MKERYLPERGRVNPADLPRGPGGRPLCRRCSVEVPKGRRTFCSDECVHEWKLRTQGAYLREQVFQRDRGRCAGCGLDMEALRRTMQRVRRQQGEAAWAERLRRLGLWECRDRSWWEVHHVKAVFEGGGACGLQNVRTLCVPCHKRRTARQRTR